MHKRIGTYMAYATACMLILSACSADPLYIADSETTNKTPIELTVGIVGENAPATKSVVTTDKNNNPAAAFSKGTSLYMVIQSEDGSNNNDNYTRTIGFAQTKVDEHKTTVDFATAYMRYWEDGQASNTRASQLSIYAACVPDYSLAASVPSGMTATGTADDAPWTVGGSTDYLNTWDGNLNSTTIAWPLLSSDDANVAVQTANFITSQDLCFSNNVSYPTGGTDNRIKFNAENKKFNSAHLVFYHALTWVTFKIKKGDGFGTGDNVFKFTNASTENIVMTGVNTSGTLEITTGEFSNVSTGTISKMYSAGADGDYVYVLHALMLPGSALTSTNTDEVYFTIDNNKYHITKAQMATALSGKKLSDTTTDALATGSAMRPGVHYVFTMTVGKQKMEKLTAAVVPWETVEATEMSPTNARITVSLLDNGTQQTGDPATFDLYRLADENTSDITDDYAGYTWSTGYVPSSTPTINKAKLTTTSTAGVYAANDFVSPYTPWYWPDNKTFYHFRTVMPVNHTVNENAGGDYIILAGSETTYTDVCWGAPFYSTSDKLYYDPTTNGFAFKSGSTTDYQISKAIGPTTGNIVIETFHMMSEVTIVVKTEGDDKLDNLNGTTISLNSIYPTGNVMMGNGLVVPTGDAATVNNSVALNGDSQVTWTYGFVPQSLSGIDLTITVNNNKYIVDMDEVLASTYSNTLIANPYTSTSNKITRWYPNFKYTYTFKLTKSRVASITATLADWENVTAGDDNVQIQ